MMDWPEIIKDTPINEIQRIHRMIWDYVIEYGEKPKTPYPTNCVCCEYVKLHDLECKDCPADWGSTFCTDDKGLYVSWWMYNNNGMLSFAREIAKQIRDIPFKEDTQ